jgi:predicted GNAT family acetyltransferase
MPVAVFSSDSIISRFSSQSSHSILSKFINMNILHEDNGKLGSFYIEEDASRVAELAYMWRRKDIISIDHTEVDEHLENKGIGKSLVDNTVAFAREKGLKILLYCEFAKAIFDRNPAYNDLRVYSCD